MKNCHLLRHKIATFTFLSLIALEASTGWATTIQGNLEIKARSGSDTANGDLTVEGNTTLKGNTILGNQASDTMTINGSITADGDLTVDGNLKIQSVDSGIDGGGVVINIDDSDNKIPTTQAVKDYIDSTTPVSLYHSNTDSTPYTFRRLSQISKLWSLITKDNSDAQNNVSRMIRTGERLVFTHFIAHDLGLKQAHEIVINKQPCEEGVDRLTIDRKNYGYLAYGHLEKAVMVSLSYEHTSASPQTLYFCAWFYELINNGRIDSTSEYHNFEYVHIAIHPSRV